MWTSRASTPQPSLRRRFALWFGLLFVLGAVGLRVAYYQATIETLGRDVDELLWSRLGGVRTLERFQADLQLAAEIRPDGRLLPPLPAAPGPSGGWRFWPTRPQIDAGSLPWFAGVWRTDGEPVDSAGLPAGFTFDPDWSRRTETIWTTADGRYRLAAMAGVRETICLTGLELAGLSAAERQVGRFELLTFAVWVPLVLGVAWVLLSRLLEPLAAIAATARRIRGGRFDERIDLVHSDAEFQELGGTLNAMLDRLGAIRESQARFNADLAHQLMNPVHAILLESEAAARQAPSATELAAAAERTGSLARRIETLCEVMLAYSRSAALDPARLQPLDLEPVICEAIGRIASRAAAGQVAIVPPAGGAVVPGDAALLEEVFVNLVANAIEHSPPGGTVELEVEDAPTGCRVSVIDHGPGVNEAALPHLFERFQSGKPAGGHGIGLALSQMIMKSHGGELVHAATPGGGATFTASFPPVA
jgi:signal transduction histidine kinase